MCELSTNSSLRERLEAKPGQRVGWHQVRSSTVTHRIRIARAEHKFSCAHMTVFADGTKERLHGHNYTVAATIEVERIDLAAVIPVARIKAAIADLCRAWKERVLLAAQNPFFVVVRDAAELEFTLCGERYV